MVDGFGLGWSQATLYNEWIIPIVTPLLMQDSYAAVVTFSNDIPDSTAASADALRYHSLHRLLSSPAPDRFLVNSASQGPVRMK